MWRRNSYIIFVEDDMHKINVGPKDKDTVVAIVEEIILRTSVANKIRSLACPIWWPIHNNKQKTI